MPRNNRSDADYEIEGFSKVWKVLEALEGTAFQPVATGTIVERTGFSNDTVFRALKTLKLHGLAVSEKGKWTIGKRLMRLAGSISRHTGE